MRRTAQRLFRHLSLPRLLKAIAIISWAIAVGWAVVQPGFESILAFLSGAALFISALSIDNQRATTAEAAEATISPEQQLSDRSKMLLKVSNFWIGGVLDNSLHGAVWLELDLQYSPEAIENPWGMILQRPGYADEEVKPDVSVYSVFERAGGALLILGNPGSGKTTTLLRLARDLIELARQDSQAGIPVVFNLSSWADSRKAIAQWMIDELTTRYQLPRQTATSWVLHNKLLPLLDGLDEVKREYRDQCVTAINTYKQEAGFIDIAVCSRTEEYEALSARLRLNAAVAIQPLTLEQIDRYLSGGGTALAGARQALSADGVLQRLAATPLLLSIIALAYRNMAAEEISDTSDYEQRRKEIFDIYVWQMLHRRRESMAYQLGASIRWLRWLARELLQRSQSVFLIEELQPKWLVNVSGALDSQIDTSKAYRKKLIWLYLVASRFATGLMVGLTVTISLVLASSVTIWISDTQRWGVFGQTMGAISGLSVAVGTMAVDSYRLRREIELKPPMKARHVVPLYMSSIAIVAGVLVLSVDTLSEAILVGLSNGLIFGLLFGVREGNRGVLDEITIVEKLRFSWRKALANSYPPLLVGLVVGYSVGKLRMLLGTKIAGSVIGPTAGFVRAIFSGYITLAPDLPVAMALVVGFVGAIVYGILAGLTGGQLEVKSYPNQGIRLSMRNAVYVAIILALGFGLFFAAFIVLTSWAIPAIIAGVLFGLFVGGMAALWHGGIDVIRHYTIRIILYSIKAFPLKCVPFLDSATDHLLLRKVGGGYIFLHQYLLEHIALLDDAGITRLSSQKWPSK